jgi:hypothetical protein
LAEESEAPYEVFRVFAGPSPANADGCTAFLAELHGEPVGAGMAAVPGNVTGLFGIATLPCHCRSGYGRIFTMQNRMPRAAGRRTATRVLTLRG